MEYRLVVNGMTFVRVDSNREEYRWLVECCVYIIRFLFCFRTSFHFRNGLIKLCCMLYLVCCKSME